MKQKFSSYSVNAVVLLTIGSGVLALHTSSDRPDGESKREYVLGFVMTLGAAALYGFILPLIEFTYQKAKQVIDYQLVMEIQMVMCLFATLFCIVGMLINNDFKACLFLLCYFTMRVIFFIYYASLVTVIILLSWNY